MTKDERKRLHDIIAWSLFPLITGLLLHLTMPELAWKDYKAATVFYGLGIFLLTGISGLVRRDYAGRVLISRELVLLVLMNLSIVAFIGVIVPSPQYPGIASVHRSFFIMGEFGFLAGILFLAMLMDFPEDSSVLHFTGKTIAHAGILLVLAGGAIGSFYGDQGILTLYEGGESKVFSITQGPYRTLTGETGFIKGCSVVDAPADTTEEEIYSAYFVNCMPEFNVVISGIALVILSLAALVLLRRSVWTCMSGIIFFLFLVWAAVKLSSAPPALQSGWFIPHVGAYFTGYALLVLCSIIAAASLFYKSKRSVCMNLADKIALPAFFFLTLGLGIGSIWASEAWGIWWSWDPKESLALSQWLLLCFHMHMPSHRRLSVPGALVLIAVLVLSGFMYLGIHLLPTAEASLHVYG